MKYKMHCLFAIAMLYFPSLAFAWDEQNPPVAPPAPVQCKSETDCDRDTRHLERFVTDFYKWYVASSEIIFSQPLHKLPHEVFISHKQEHEKEEKRILKTMLSPSFYAWAFSFDAKGERAVNYKYCSDDVNFITCRQDFFKEWVTDTTSQLIAGNNSSAVIIVHMPISGNKLHQRQMPNLFSVQVKAINGAWKIDGTRWLPTD